ncbi:hypothetical protein SLEP1_g56646 [Rubroshorea leprosula]|uniref:DRBM domain-containing protein n=1 Tax=Rubroshorea leprosula TaxID=152421 RepID=A0AAV5MJD1_9ROSI|nr:hypothetical protein SLEP1_g56646 [Rubroshorea leprosula]
MHKTKLQEMCHRRRWALPKYTYMKDGPDHSPSFKASVSVNGMSFDSSPSCKSSKEALNDAARLAFLHFDSPIGCTAEGRPTSEISAGEQEIYEMPEENLDGGNGSSISSVELNARGVGLKNEQSLQRNDTVLQTVQVIDDIHCQYKTRLQNYARFKDLDAPLYCSESEGPSHKPAFKATVTVGGHTFESPAFFKTLKEAEHAAAKTALMSLYYDGIHEVDSGFYKNLLQELTQKENLSMPAYKTIKSGTLQMPTFVSSVEVEGELFYGKAGKSKKEAETKAAEAACTILKERGLGLHSGLCSSDLKIIKPISSTPSSDIVATVHSQHNHTDKSQVISSPTVKNEEHDGQYQVQEVIPGKWCKDEMVRPKDIPSCSKSAPQASTGGLFSSAKRTNPDISALSLSDSNIGKATGVRSYLLCNRVRVYTSFPHCIPEGITVMPIDDNKWVLMSLEFPNEECN